ncbi:DNA-directed RNA polymerase II subunit 2, partial [Smittium culicis]
MEDYIDEEVAEYEGDYQGEGDEIADEEDSEITQEDCWSIITRYFDENGLVRQQIASFNEFIENTLQEIVDENTHLVLQTQTQGPGRSEMLKRYHIQFEQ